MYVKMKNRAGHSAVIHGCTVEDDAFVGMGATLLDGVVVEKHAMVAAGSLVKQNTRVPSGEVSFCTLFIIWFTVYWVCDYTGTGNCFTSL